MAARARKSKKRSAASSTEKLLKSVTFFLDQDFGTHIVPNALRRFGAPVEILTDHFPDGTPDAVWLKEVGRRGWIVFTYDKGIRYRTTEREALFSAGVKAFVFTAANVGGQEAATILIKALPKILRFVVSHKAPFIATVTKSGSVSMLKQV